MLPVPQRFKKKESSRSRVSFSEHAPVESKKSKPGLSYIRTTKGGNNLGDAVPLCEVCFIARRFFFRTERQLQKGFAAFIDVLQSAINPYIFKKFSILCIKLKSRTETDG
jgi:hypothetical protein